jgi:multiple sugar transport system substrate-binding protein
MKRAKMSRRSFLRMGTMTAAGFALVACAKPSTAPEEGATEAPKEEAAQPPAAEAGQMVFWPEWGGKDADALQVQVNKFAEETGIAVEYLPVRDHARMIASMGAGSPPDLLMTWDAGAVGTWAYNGAIIELDPYIESSGFDMATLHPLGVAAGKQLGKQIGMPLSNYLNSVVYWNKKVFDEAGLDRETPPETWEELWAMHQEITTVEGGQIKRWGFEVNTGQYGGILKYGWGGPGIYSEDGTEIACDNPNHIEALYYTRRFYEEYGVDEVRRWIDSMAGAEASPFFTGGSGMNITGEWQPSWINSMDLPDLDYGAGYMPYPEAKPERKGTMVANSNPMVIPAAAKNPDLGWKFIEFISRGENSAEMCDIVGNASPVKEGIRLLIDLTEDPKYKWMLEEVWTNATIYPMTVTSPVGSMYGDVLNRELELVWSLEKTPEEAMKTVKDEMQPQLDEALEEASA